MSCKKRIGILTAGGDCPGLNAVLRAVGKSLIPNGYEIVGFEDGFLGVLQRRYRILSNLDLSGILTLGGTILGTSNKDNPFEWIPPNHMDDADAKPADYSDRCVEILEELGCEGLVVIGGDGSQSMSLRFMKEKNVKCIGVPKTIDNDLNATDVTFGFDTAVQRATTSLDCLHSTAMSHHRAMCVEVMGRYAGWLALHAGVAGGGDVILLPEIPFSMEKVCEYLQERKQEGKRFSIVVVSEGAKLNGEFVIERQVKNSLDPIRLGGISQKVAAEIEARLGIESRATILGHLQRGGSPTSRDRILASQFGFKAAELVLEGAWGMMSAWQKGLITAVPIEEAVSSLKLVQPDDPLIRFAKSIGTCFGD